MYDACRVEGCDRVETLRRGLCHKHYQRLMRTGTTDLIPRRDHPFHLRPERRLCAWRGLVAADQAGEVCDRIVRTQPVPAGLLLALGMIERKEAA